MKKVSIQDLKATLSSAVAEAESGETLLITRHGDPVAQLGPADAAGLHPGSRGSGRLEPALSRGTQGRYLSVLLEDRAGR